MIDYQKKGIIIDVLSYIGIVVLFAGMLVVLMSIS